MFPGAIPIRGFCIIQVVIVSFATPCSLTPAHVITVTRRLSAFREMCWKCSFIRYCQIFGIQSWTRYQRISPAVTPDLILSSKQTSVLPSNPSCWNADHSWLLSISRRGQHLQSEEQLYCDSSTFQLKASIIKHITEGPSLQCAV